MRSASVLLLEDELQLAKIVSEILQSRGFVVEQYANGRAGLEAAGKSAFDVCIVDVMMPVMDGFSFARELRKTDRNIPVLFLTARSADKDVIEGYGSGGNDYLKKPFSLEELILRVNELIKRSHYQEHDLVEPVGIGSFRYFSQRQELINNKEQIIKLSYRESELLLLLVQHKNQVLDRKASLMKLWGDDNSFNARTMDVFITKLRKHLKDDPSVQILNIRGVGYKLLC
jgi:DNA-binding response OmpR family regulator